MIFLCFCVAFGVTSRMVRLAHVGQSPVNHPKRYQQVVLPDLSTYITLQPAQLLGSGRSQIIYTLNQTNCKKTTRVQLSNVIKVL